MVCYSSLCLAVLFNKLCNFVIMFPQISQIVDSVFLRSKRRAMNWYLSMVGIACCNLGRPGGMLPQENLDFYIILRSILVHFKSTLIMCFNKRYCGQCLLYSSLKTRGIYPPGFRLGGVGIFLPPSAPLVLMPCSVSLSLSGWRLSMGCC